MMGKGEIGNGGRKEDARAGTGLSQRGSSRAKAKTRYLDKKK
jgi:hypothetical protein